MSKPSIAAHDIGGAVGLRALLMEGAQYRVLTLMDAVSGPVRRGLYRLT